MLRIIYIRETDVVTDGEGPVNAPLAQAGHDVPGSDLTD